MKSQTALGSFLSRERPGPCLSRELGHGGIVAGVDEAGRGPLAGPVVAAAVVLDPDCYPDGLNDSKVLTAARREALLTMLRDCAAIGVGIASVDEIAALNILGATMLAMERAVTALARQPGHVLVDGNRAPRWAHATTTIVGGDALSLSIAAASIVAKVTRDALMTDLARGHPGYGWASNMGYPTAEHRAALVRLGATIHHRAGFAPVAAVLQSARG
jgi:ribonuclease HII